MKLLICFHVFKYLQLKGRRNQDLEQEINSYVKRLEMESKLNCRAATLSGGYKRKLSVCIALVGKSKVIQFFIPVIFIHLYQTIQCTALCFMSYRICAPMKY